jgi:ubiquinone/menaquinone biosynthesis C-methylase UbiE
MALMWQVRGDRQASLSVGKSLFEHYAEYYSEDQSLSEWRQLGAIDKAKNIIGLCTSFPHGDVLEIGCGDGAVLEKLAADGFGGRFTGLEISQSALRCAEKKQIPNTTVYPFDGAEIPFHNQIFDLAILTHVLEHVEYPRQLLYEAARVAKHVFVEVPLEDNARLPKDFVLDPVGHINVYNPRSIRHLVQSCGFNILRTQLLHSSLPLYTYRKGRLRGYFGYMLKNMGIMCLPRLATQVLTYHCALIFTGGKAASRP